IADRSEQQPWDRLAAGVEHLELCIERRAGPCCPGLDDPLVTSLGLESEKVVIAVLPAVRGENLACRNSRRGDARRLLGAVVRLDCGALRQLVECGLRPVINFRRHFSERYQWPLIGRGRRWQLVGAEAAIHAANDERFAIGGDRQAASPVALPLERLTDR